MCVCFLPIHSGHQVRWTYPAGSHRRKVTQDFPSTFLRCVPLFFSRERFSHSFPSSTLEVEIIFILKFFSEKNPVCRDRTHVPTCQRLYGTSELPGRPVLKSNRSTVVIGITIVIIVTVIIIIVVIVLLIEVTTFTSKS